MEPRFIAAYAEIKGLNIIGTGDFTHLLWLRTLRDELIKCEDSEGLYELKEGTYDLKFILQTEVSTIFNFSGRTRKVHHVILSPSFEVVDQINDRLRFFGDLEADGRPTLNMSPPELVEILKSISDDVEIYPAHAWTPWYGVFGSKSGFNSLKECYQDKTDEIHALETGLSSDPPMNWRLSSLDKITLISASDAHSPYPLRIGREATVFRLRKLSYFSIIHAIRSKNPTELIFTIEVPPQYGKYFFTGHRKCRVVLSPEESLKLGNICPVCGKKLTIGVKQRVEELANRPELSRPPANFPGFVYMLPLEDILNKVGLETNAGNLYNKLVDKAGNEYKVLIKMTYEEISQIANKRLALAIKFLREGKFSFEPGYDGVYGRVTFPIEGKQVKRKFKTTSLEEFM